MTAMLIEWAATSVFLILTVLVLRAAFGKRVSARLRYALWAVVLVRLLVPVQLFTSPLAGTRVLTEKHTEQHVTDPSYLWNADPLDGPADPILNIPEGAAAPLNPPKVPDAPNPPPAPDLTHASGVLGWIWLGGSAAMALVLAASNLRFARRLRRCRIPVEGTDCPLPVYAAVGLPSPCLFGLARPAVYVTPEAAADPVMLRHVAAHEYTHFRHGDHIWSFLRCAALAAHWWNPLVWLAVALSRRDGELACDEGALRRLGDGERLAYGNTLLALVTAKPRPGELLCFATTMAGDKKSLKERVSRIARAPKRVLWAAVAVVLVTVLACACAFGQASEPDDPKDDPAPAPTASPAVTEPPAPGDEQYTDLNRNGIPEDLRVTELEAGSDAEGSQRLEVWENGELIFSEEAYHSHAGYNAVFLCTLDGKDYLLRYNPYTAQGGASYTYKLFTLSENGEEQTVWENSIDFCIHFMSPVAFSEPFINSFDPEKIAVFMDEINDLLANSVQLINTDSELLATFQEEGRLYDHLSWMDSDPSKSMLENLRDYRVSMVGAEKVAYYSVLLGYSQFTLSPEGTPVSIGDVPDLFWADDPYTKIREFTVVDMDGDGTDEALLYVCGVAGDMGGYLLLRQEDGQVCGTVFNAHNNWSNRWFNNLKTDGTFECQGIMDSWHSISKLFFTAGGGTGLYGLTVIRNNPDYDLESFMVIQNEITREDDWRAAVEAQKEKPDAVWYDFDEENINVVFRS